MPIGNPEINSRPWALKAALPVGLLLAIVAFIFIFSGKVEFRAQEWTTFFNAKIPVTWVNLITALSVFFGFDWMYPGKTIATIVAIDSYSPIERIQVAAMFMIGFFWGIVWLLKGSIF